MKTLQALALATLVLTGCLENEEQITVRPDGSLEVRLSAKGQPDDLATGYALPFDGPFAAADETTRGWVDALGSATGGAALKLRVEEAIGNGELDPEADVKLSVVAQLPSVEALPRWHAPEDEPYRTAYLERGATLSIERRGSRTVYVFERTYRGRAFAGLHVMNGLEERLSDPLREKIDHPETLTGPEWRAVSDAFRAAFVESGRRYLRSAIGAVYTLGDASVPTRVVDRARAAVEPALLAEVGYERLERLYEQVRALEVLSDDDPEHDRLNDEVAQHLRSLEDDSRTALRSTLERVLVDEGIDRVTRNAIRARLEWTFTAFDHTGDLGDETFRLTLRLPGKIVDGNFDELEDGAARWEFAGEDLRDHDVVLRAVSVLE